MWYRPAPAPTSAASGAMRGWMLLAVGAALRAARGDGVFVIPPDTNVPIPNDTLTYAYGETMEAQWLTDWHTVTLSLNSCGGQDQHVLLTNASNQNGYSFLLDRTIPANCPDYSLRLVPVLDEHGTPPVKSYAINSQNFKLLNVSNPPNPVGTIVETVTTGVSEFLTFTIATTISASFTPLWQYAGEATSTSAPVTSAMNQPNEAADPTATSVSSASAATNSAASSSAAGGGGSGLSDATKIGLGVGLGVGLLLLIGVVACVVRSRRRRAETAGGGSPLRSTYADDARQQGTAIGGLKTIKVPGEAPVAREMTKLSQPRPNDTYSGMSSLHEAG